VTTIDCVWAAAQAAIAVTACGFAIYGSVGLATAAVLCPCCGALGAIGGALTTCTSGGVWAAIGSILSAIGSACGVVLSVT